MGREVVSSGKQFASDVMSGRNLKESAKERGKEGINRAINRMLDSSPLGVVGSRGSNPPGKGRRKQGVKRKGYPASSTGRPKKKKHKANRYNDIFS